MTPHRQKAAVTALIGLGLIIVGFFGFRTVHAFKEFRDHRPPPFKNEQPETDVKLIRDWMTIPFIARMYQVPPPVIYDALDIPKDNKNFEKSLRELNDEYYPDAAGYVEAKVKEVVLQNLPQVIPTAPSTPTMPGVPIP